MNIFSMLRKTNRFREGISIIEGNNSITYSKMFENIGMLSMQIKINVKSGDGVVLIGENSIEYICILLAIYKLKAIAIPIPLKSTGLKTLYSSIFNSKPKCIIMSKTINVSDHEYLDKIIESEYYKDYCFGNYTVYIAKSNVPIFSRKNIASIIYTSGTTGKIKGVMLSHENILKNAKAVCDYLEIDNNDKTLLILPIYYIYGLSVLVTHFLVGATVVIENNFIFLNSIKKRINELKITNMSGVALHFSTILNKSSYTSIDFPTIKFFTQAGGVMHPDDVKHLIDRFEGIKIFLMYGQSEAGPRITYLPPEKIKIKMGSIGKPIKGIKVRIVNSGHNVRCGQVGELVCKSAGTFIGYYNDIISTKKKKKNGWLYTGDYVRMDNEGFLYFFGRNDDIIKINGIRTSLARIKEEILDSGMFIDVALLKIENEIALDKLYCFYVIKSNVHLECAIENIMKLKIFNRSELVSLNEIPATASGKIDYKKLIDMITNNDIHIRNSSISGGTE